MLEVIYSFGGTENAGLESDGKWKWKGPIL